MNRGTENLSDDEIRTADVLVLVDPERPGWQELLWSAAIDDDSGNSATMEIVEIPVDSREVNQVEAARERVARIKRET